MPSNRDTETTFELTTIERLKREGYVWQSGLDIQRPDDEVVLKDVLRENLPTRYPDLPGPVLHEAVARVSRPEGVDTIRRNKAFHEMRVRVLCFRWNCKMGQGRTAISAH